MHIRGRTLNCANKGSPELLHSSDYVVNRSDADVYQTGHLLVFVIIILMV